MKIKSKFLNVYIWHFISKKKVLNCLHFKAIFIPVIIYKNNMMTYNIPLTVICQTHLCNLQPSKTLLIFRTHSYLLLITSCLGMRQTIRPLNTPVSQRILRNILYFLLEFSTATPHNINISSVSDRHSTLFAKKAFGQCSMASLLETAHRQQHKKIKVREQQHSL